MPAIQIESCASPNEKPALTTLDIRTLIQNVSTDWRQILEIINTEKNYTNEIDSLIKLENVKFNNELSVFPPPQLIFSAFNHFNFNDLKVVICGQDPYPQKEQAMGMSFSVPNHLKTPPSLRNIFKEIKDDLGIDNVNTDLTPWAKQGVLLLNSGLTTREHVTNCHQKVWAPFTSEIIRFISEDQDGIIFMLWGNHAKDKKKLIDEDRHHVLEWSHPSPLARQSFVGCKHFSRCNQILLALSDGLDATAINWQT